LRAEWEKDRAQAALHKSQEGESHLFANLSRQATALSASRP
jgi:hypothetical protein